MSPKKNTERPRGKTTSSVFNLSRSEGRESDCRYNVAIKKKKPRLFFCLRETADPEVGDKKRRSNYVSFLLVRSLGKSMPNEKKKFVRIFPSGKLRQILRIYSYFFRFFLRISRPLQQKGDSSLLMEY